MRVTAVIQCRLSSKRLPRKALLDLHGQPLLARVIERVRAMKTVDRIAVATVKEDAPDLAPIAKAAGADELFAWRGPVDDVLGRFVAATREADIVVRVTADTPLLSPDVGDTVVQRLIDRYRHADYVSPVLDRTYPRGAGDIEAMTIDTLHRLDRKATLSRHREHVTLLLREYRDGWCLENVRNPAFNTYSSDDREEIAAGINRMQWSVDTAEDLERVRRIYEACDGKILSYEETLKRARGVL